MHKQSTDTFAAFIFFFFAAFILCYLKVKTDQKVNKEETWEQGKNQELEKSNHKVPTSQFTNVTFIHSK